MVAITKSYMLLSWYASKTKCVFRERTLEMKNQLNQYYIFYVTAKCGNISRAAKHLYISQPAVSKAISRLEESFHTPLFFRSSRGVALTEEGELLYRQLETAFHAIRTGEEQLVEKEAAGGGQLSIGVSTTLCKYVLLPYLKEFIRENPHIRVSIFCQSSNETIEALEKGRLDIGLTGEPGRTGLLFRPIKTISDVFVTTEDYLKLLVKRTQAEDELSAERELFSKATLLLLHKGNMSRQYVDKYLLLRDISFEQQLEVTTMDLLIDFAKIGMGIACVIRDFVEKELEEGSLVLFPVKEPIPSRRIGFLCTGKQTTPSMQKFLRLFD